MLVPCRWTLSSRRCTHSSLHSTCLEHCCSQSPFTYWAQNRSMEWSVRLPEVLWQYFFFFNFSSLVLLFEIILIRSQVPWIDSLSFFVFIFLFCFFPSLSERFPWPYHLSFLLSVLKKSQNIDHIYYIFRYILCVLFLFKLHPVLVSYIYQRLNFLDDLIRIFLEFRAKKKLTSFYFFHSLITNHSYNFGIFQFRVTYAWYMMLLYCMFCIFI